MCREVPNEERPGRFGLFGSRDVHSEIHRVLYRQKTNNGLVVLIIVNNLCIGLIFHHYEEYVLIG